MDNDNFFSNLVTFDKMITPTIIKIIFWVGSVIAIIAGLGMLFQGGRFVIIGLLWIVLGPLMVRIYCELIIVVFKIHDNVREMNQRGGGSSGGSTTTGPDL